jgi:cytochrome o ubiquinol oxidase operon protein cyoD
MKHQHNEPDFGTGKKKLGVYLLGFIMCSILTLIAFGSVMANQFPKGILLSIIFIAASIQFLVQLICFLRLNIQTPQGKLNVMSFVFTGVILGTIVVGSLWIMWNCNYYMSH